METFIHQLTSKVKEAEDVDGDMSKQELWHMRKRSGIEIKWKTKIIEAIYLSIYLTKS